MPSFMSNNNSLGGSCTTTITTSNIQPNIQGSSGYAQNFESSLINSVLNQTTTSSPSTSNGFIYQQNNQHNNQLPICQPSSQTMSASTGISGGQSMPNPTIANNLRDIKISSFTANAQINIPISADPNNPSQPAQSIVIQPGEKVFILKTPRGCYLRTPDKRYVALRSRSLEDSIWHSQHNHHQQQSPPNELSSSFTQSTTSPGIDQIGVFQSPTYSVSSSQSLDYNQQQQQQQFQPQPPQQNQSEYYSNVSTAAHCSIIKPDIVQQQEHQQAAICENDSNGLSMNSPFDDQLF